MMKIFEHIDTHYQKNLPFVAFKKPGAKTCTAYFQKDPTLHTISEFHEKGFLFAPFSKEAPIILIPESQAVVVSEPVNLLANYPLHDTVQGLDSQKEHHISLVKKAKSVMEQSGISKIVVSRCERVPLKECPLSKRFETLLYHYDSAFVYVWFHPKIGLWMGATPETLVKFQGNRFQTMSLAATQVYNNTLAVEWGAKELEEQSLVTQFIEDQLSGITVKLEIGERETVKAGSLLHLKTVISGSLLPNAQIKDVVHALHPTPAVCGLPREQAKDFILQNEGYDRTYYTGYLGELDAHHETSLFVNLRCMSLEDDMAKIYVGGGITPGSDPDKEWEETVAKSTIMKKIIA